MNSVSPKDREETTSQQKSKTSSNDNNKVGDGAPSTGMPSKNDGVNEVANGKTAPPEALSSVGTSGNSCVDKENERLRKLLDVFPPNESDTSSNSSAVPLDEDDEEEKMEAAQRLLLSPLNGASSGVGKGIPEFTSAEDFPSVRHRRRQLRGDCLPPLAYNHLSPPPAGHTTSDGSVSGTPTRRGSGVFSPDMYSSPTSYRRGYYQGRYGYINGKYSSPVTDGSPMAEWVEGSPSSNYGGDFASPMIAYPVGGVPPSPSAMSTAGDAGSASIPTLKEGQPHRCASENRMLRQILVATSSLLWVPYVVAALYVAYCDSFTVVGDDGRFPRPRRDYPAIYYLVFRDGFDVLQFLWRAMPIGFFSVIVVSVTTWLCQVPGEQIPVYLVAFAWFVGVSSFYFWGTDEVHYNKTESFLTSRSTSFPSSAGSFSSRNNNFTSSADGSAFNGTNSLLSTGSSGRTSNSGGWWSSVPPLPSPFMRNRFTTSSVLPFCSKESAAQNQSSSELSSSISSSSPSFSSSPASAAVAAAAAARSGLASWDEAFFSLLLQRGLVRVQDDLPTPSPWMWMWVSVSTGLLAGVLCKVWDRLQHKRRRMKRWSRGYYQGRRGSAARSPAPCGSPDSAAAAAACVADTAGPTSATLDRKGEPAPKADERPSGVSGRHRAGESGPTDPSVPVARTDADLPVPSREMERGELWQKLPSSELLTPSASQHPDMLASGGTNTSTPVSRSCALGVGSVGGESTPPVVGVTADHAGVSHSAREMGIRRVGSTAQVAVGGGSNTSFSSVGYHQRLSPAPPMVGGVAVLENGLLPAHPTPPPSFMRRDRIVIRPRMKRVTQASRAMSLHMSLVIPFCTGQWFSLMIRYGWRGFLIQNLVVTVTLGFIGYTSICFQLIRKHLKRSSRELFESGTVVVRHRTLPNGTQVAEEEEIVVEMVEHQVDYMLFFYRLFATKMGLFVVMMICLHVYVTSWMITMIQTLYTLNALVSGAGILVELLIYEVV